MKPLLKWTGGKRRIADLIARKVQEQMTDRSRYIELFAGGAAVFFYMEPKNAVLVDLCKPLVSFYEAVRREPGSFSDELDRLIELPFGEETFQRVRAEWNGRDFGVRFAARLMYLNRTCFNGLFRLNSNLEFNVPWGKKEKLPEFPSREEIKRASDLLKRATIYNNDYSYVLRATHKGDVAYADPPYLGTYDGYTGSEFTHKDHRKLAAGLHRAAKRGVSVFTSNVGSEDVRSLYGWATVETVSVRHNVGASAASRKVVDEILASAIGPVSDPRQLALFSRIANG